MTIRKAPAKFRIVTEYLAEGAYFRAYRPLDPHAYATAKWHGHTLVVRHRRVPTTLRLGGAPKWDWHDVCTHTWGGDQKPTVREMHDLFWSLLVGDDLCEVCAYPDGEST